MHNHQTRLGPWDSDLWQNEHMHRWWSGRCCHVSMAIAVFAAGNFHQWQTAHPLTLIKHQELSHWQARTSTAHPPVMPCLAAVESLVIRTVTTESCKVRTCLRRLSWLLLWSVGIEAEDQLSLDTRQLWLISLRPVFWLGPSFWRPDLLLRVLPWLSRWHGPTSLALLTFTDTSATTPVAMFLRVGSSANGFLSRRGPSCISCPWLILLAPSQRVGRW